MSQDLLSEKYYELSQARARVREIELEILTIEQEAQHRRLAAMPVGSLLAKTVEHTVSAVRPETSMPRSISTLGTIIRPDGGPGSAPLQESLNVPGIAPGRGVLRIIP